MVAIRFCYLTTGTNFSLLEEEKILPTLEEKKKNLGLAKLIFEST